MTHPNISTQQRRNRKSYHTKLGSKSAKHWFFSYLWVDLLKLGVILVDLKVDLGGRDRDGTRGRYARTHQHSRRADINWAWRKRT